MFRPAQVDDLEHIVDLIVQINQKVGQVYGIPMKAESLIKTVLHTIKRGICLVGAHGCAGGFISPYPWDHAVQVGTILFWNYDRPSGIRVFEAMIQAFKTHGATHISCSSHFPANLAGRYYRRFDLIPAEVEYIASIAAMKKPFAKLPEVACPH